LFKRLAAAGVNVLGFLLFPFVVLRLLWRSRKNTAYRYRIKERLGFSPCLQASVWVHAVSVGEVIAVSPLIEKLLTTLSTPILVTTMTPTGSAQVKKQFGDRVAHCYVPYDVPHFVSRFFKRSKPTIALIVETELWPTLFRCCEEKNIPLMILNARLSERAYERYQKIKWLTKKMLARVTNLLAANEKDLERFFNLGLPKARGNVAGNLKYDIVLPELAMEQSVALRKQLGLKREVWIGASTHEGEDEMLLVAHRKIQEHYPKALLIIVPRHPERFDGVAKSIEDSGFTVTRRSAGKQSLESSAVYLGDTMGELITLYGASDVVFVGGSLVHHGGHNLLEPAVLAKPLLSGPHDFNFTAINQTLFANQALLKVNSSDEISEHVKRLFGDANERHAMGGRAKKVVAENQGALKRHLDAIHSFLR
jgi:3-deoxy-D-manno-octulosonic-acid transferase